MRQYRLSTLLMLPIVLMLLLLPIIPHHHHGGEMCVAMEYCHHDHATNDMHTHHHGDSSTCVAESDIFLTSSSSTSAHYKQKAKHIFLLSAIVGSLFTIGSKDDINICTYEPASGYKPKTLYPHFSLKAPPVL